MISQTYSECNCLLIVVGVFGNLGKRFPAVLWSSALGIGFYAGVASYQQACFDQIMKLENSTLAEQLRARER